MLKDVREEASRTELSDRGLIEVFLTLVLEVTDHRCLVQDEDRVLLAVVKFSQPSDGFPEVFEFGARILRLSLIFHNPVNMLVNGSRVEPRFPAEHQRGFSGRREKPGV